MLLNSIGKMGVNSTLLVNADCTRVDHALNSNGKNGKGVVPKESVSTLQQRSAKTSADSTKKDYVGIRWFPCQKAQGKTQGVRSQECLVGGSNTVKY